MAINEWSTTPGNNASGVTGVNWAEGQAPSTVNDSARAVMADVAAWYGQAKLPQYLSSVSGTNTVVGTGPASMSAYLAGQVFSFIQATTNTGAATLNITPSGGAALGAKNIFYRGVACVGGELVTSTPVTVLYDGTQFNIIVSPHNFVTAEQASTSGTSIDFTGIPSWVKKITVMFVGVSTSGTDNWLIQIGDSGGVETSGYLGTGAAASNTTTVSAANSTAGALLPTGSAAFIAHGSVTWSREDGSDHTWVANGMIGRSDTNGIVWTCSSKALSPGPLDRVRVTTTAGSDTFDAGVISVMYE